MGQSSSSAGKSGKSAPVATAKATAASGSGDSGTVWSGDKVRSSFVEYFKSKGHTHWPSSSVVPINDPTLLFANAGTLIVSVGCL
jgi:hypothetical protein